MLYNHGSAGFRGYSRGVHRLPRSRTRTFIPFSASLHAVMAPPKPLPITIASNVRFIIWKPVRPRGTRVVQIEGVKRGVGFSAAYATVKLSQKGMPAPKML